MQLDLQYIDTWFLWLDLEILVRTIPGNMKGSGPLMMIPEVCCSYCLGLLHWMKDRHCPSCDSVKVRRSARKNFFEAALFAIFLTRPFRCESCG